MEFRRTLSYSWTVNYYVDYNRRLNNDDHIGANCI